MIALVGDFIKAWKGSSYDIDYYTKNLRKNSVPSSIDGWKEPAFVLPYETVHGNQIPLKIYIKHIFLEFEGEPIIFLCCDKEEKYYWICNCIEIRNAQIWIISDINIDELRSIIIYRNEAEYINKYPEWVVLYNGKNEKYVQVKSNENIISILGKGTIPDKDIKLEYFNYLDTLKKLNLISNFPSTNDILNDYLNKNKLNELYDDIGNSLMALGFKQEKSYAD